MPTKTCDELSEEEWAFMRFKGRCYFYPQRDCPGWGKTCGRIGEKIPMGLYRITIEKAETQKDGSLIVWHTAAIIRASTSFTLATAIPEWVKEDVDPGAEIVIPCTLPLPHRDSDCEGAHFNGAARDDDGMLWPFSVASDEEYPHNPVNVTCPGPGIKCLCYDIDHGGDK